MHKMTSTYNWAARGFVTYYDSNGNLITEYSVTKSISLTGKILMR